MTRPEEIAAALARELGLADAVPVLVADRSNLVLRIGGVIADWLAAHVRARPDMELDVGSEDDALPLGSFDRGSRRAGVGGDRFADTRAVEGDGRGRLWRRDRQGEEGRSPGHRLRRREDAADVVEG